MKILHTLLTACAVVGLGAATAAAQTPAPPPTGAQPSYAVAQPPRTSKLAAPAGKDLDSVRISPADVKNQGAIDPKNWKYGDSRGHNPPAGAKIWNPVMAKMKAGQKVTGGTIFNVTDHSVYCAMANAGYDYIWTEMQHSTMTWDQTAKLWNSCPFARAVPGARVAFSEEKEIQHATDSGALVVIVPTVDTEEEAIEARNWTYFPPLGRRSQGGGWAFANNMYGEVPGGYRQTANDNIVLVLMIETLEGVVNAEKIAKVPGVTAIFAASGDLANFSGFEQDTPDYERLINAVHEGALRAGKRLCGPFAWRERPDFTCFQNQQQTGAMMTGARIELGDLWNTTGKVEVGPWAGLTK
jgi:2-keto-3-deoxy-L-rhamnonate aldolase RhmA